MASVPYDWLLLGAVLFALLSGGRAFIASAILTACWLLFDAAWWPQSPVALIGRAGLHMSYIDVWACTDFLASVAILAIGRFYKPWAWALWALLTAQIFMHVCHELGMAFQPYKVVLDTLFLMQLLVLCIEGGQHIGRRMSDLRVLLRGVFLVPGAPSREGG